MFAKDSEDEKHLNWSNPQSCKSRKSRVNGNIRTWMDYFKLKQQDSKCDFFSLKISVKIFKANYQLMFQS